MLNLNRDSIGWWLVILVSAAAYLSTMPPPNVWTWAQWMQTIAALAGTMAGKLATSPLPGKFD